KVEPTPTNLNELVLHFKMPSLLDLYYAVATNKLDLRELKKFKIIGDKWTAPISEEKLLKGKNKVSAEDEILKQKPGKDTELIIFGESADNILYKLANCCQPIPGDDVFGFITASDGLKIHRTDCPNASRLLSHYGHRIIKTKWAKNKELSFLCGLRITGLDDVGVIQKMTNIISAELKMNMRSISVDSNDGVFEGTIMIFVKDREELAVLKDRLEHVDGISKVDRLEAGE